MQGQPEVGQRCWLPRETFAAGLPELVQCQIVKVLDDGRVRVAVTQNSRVHRDVAPEELEGLVVAEVAVASGGQLRPPVGDEITDEMRTRGRAEVAQAFEGELEERPVVEGAEMGEAPEAPEVLEVPEAKAPGEKAPSTEGRRV